MSINGCISEEVAVTSGVPQGSVLGPTLFLLYINDLPEIFKSSDTICKLFADDVKLYNTSSLQLQRSLDKIVEWSEKWQLQLAPDKCQILSLIGYNKNFNPCEFWINNHRLSRVGTIRDLGVLIDSSLKFVHHIDNITRKAAIISKLILASFSSRDPDILKKAFCTYVRPILEYSSPVWNPHKKLLIDRIEKIQKRYTKAIPTLAHYPYLQRLKTLKLPTLEKRRLLADLTLCYKLQNGFIHSNISTTLIRSTYTRTRGHNHKLRTRKSRCEISKHFFSNRIVRSWNSLPAHIVNSSTTNRFNSEICKLNLNPYLRFQEL